MKGTSTPENISTRLDRIAELARKAPSMAVRTLAHHIDIEFLHEAYRRTRKDGAAGIDGQTAAEYEQDLEGNFQQLLNRFKSGTYKAPPVKRAYIPKGEGKLRPIGIPTLEDKILQRAVAMVMEPIYEQDFHPDSYGFRPGRSAHQALEKLWRSTMNMGGGWLLEADIEDFFGTLRHDILREFLDKRVSDGVIRRTLHKWLNAGVMEEGEIKRTEAGTPQGGVISPLLANIYLHEVLDTWFETDVKPRLKGEAQLIRYADDFVIVFAQECDARRVKDVLEKRFAKYGLRLHPVKTRLIDFRKPPDDGGNGTFDFLGFTHYWSKSRKGKMWVNRKTSKGRLKRAVKRIAEWCKLNRHKKVSERHRELTAKLRGHYAYYGITGNYQGLSRFHQLVEQTWLKWLMRRSEKKRLNWAHFNNYLKENPLMPPRVTKSALRA